MRDGNRRERRATTLVAALTGAALLAGLSGCGMDSPPQAGPTGRSTPVWDRSPKSVAALGDSITRGFDACGVLSDCPEASWATGTDPVVDSLAQRLMSQPGKHTWNFARTGARMADLPGQMRAAMRKKPELVTVLAGANDACRNQVKQMTTVAAFRADFEGAVAALRRSLPKTQVYVASIPDLRRLWSEGRKNRWGKQIWRLGLCPSMLGDAESMNRAATERRQQVYDRVVAYNEVLKDVCDRDALCRYDGGAVFAYRFTGDQLSVWDWFHPSRNGQEWLADTAYRHITARESGA